LNTDPNHCNGCSNVCSAPHAVPGCMGGMCGLLGCNTGYYDCDGISFNGCESTTACSG
jgi:hypothetical protein